MIGTEKDETMEISHFDVWTEKGMHIETIVRDDEFFNTHLSRANEVCKVAILPELLAKWYTQPKESSSDAKSAHSHSVQ